MDQFERDTASRDMFWNAIVHQMRSKLESLEALGDLQNTKLDEPLVNEFSAWTTEAVLSVWLHPEDGKGSWSVVSKRLDKAEPWSMTANGVIALNGEQVDITGAVEKFAVKLITK